MKKIRSCILAGALSLAGLFSPVAPCIVAPSIVAIVSLSISSPSQAADATATIFWRNDQSPSGAPTSSTFTTNILFAVPNLGDTRTLDVVPQGGFQFKGNITVMPSGLSTNGSPGKVSNTLASYIFKIISPTKQGTANITGKIERIPAGGGGGAGPSPDRMFKVSVFQKWARIFFTPPTTITNVFCAGSTNILKTKVMLGNAAPASGVTSFSLSPTTLGQFTITNVNMSSSGVATTKFIANTNGVLSGMIIATASNLVVTVGSTTIKLPPNFSVSTNSVAHVPKVELVTPAGDPVAAPDDAGDGQNEFTFSNAATGVLTINFKAKVTPNTPEVRNALNGKLKFTIEGIGNSIKTWAAANPGGKATLSGDFFVATVKFTKLPSNNSAFGKKKVTVLCNGIKQDEEMCEVFFPKNQTNHPSNAGNANWPNWMFYWMQTVTPLLPANFTYGASTFFTPGSNVITLSAGDSGSYTAPYSTHNPLQGIDNFAWTIRHESQHHKDWVDLWNNNVATWNAAKGLLGPNDDKDSDAIPNKIEDVDLSQTYNAGDLYDWSDYNTPTPGRPAAIINDFEDWDCQRNTGIIGDHSQDWGNPGMQHKTIGNYND